MNGISRTFVTSLAAVSLAGCSTGGESQGSRPSRESAGAVEMDSLTFPVREAVEAIAVAPDLGQHRGGIFAFLDAPGRRIQIYNSFDGRDWQPAGIFDRAGQVYDAVMWNPVDGLALQGGADACVIYKTGKGWREHSITAKLEGRYVKLMIAAAPAEPGGHGAVCAVGSNRDGRASVLLTKDGSNFEEIARFEGPPPRHAADFAIMNNNRFIVGGTDGRGVLLRAEGEGPFRRVDVGEIPNLLSIAFDSEGNGLAVGDNGECLRSADRGFTWKPVLSGSEKPLASVIFIKNRHAYVCGRDGIVLFTKDAGLTFENVVVGRRDDFFRLQFAPGGGAWALGARGVAPHLPPR